MTPKIGIYNHLTGEDNVREMTADELAEFQQQSAVFQADIAQRKADAENAWRTKVSAYEKLQLTPEEIEALAPTPEWLKPKETKPMGGN